MRTIGFVTGSRSDYGGLRPIVAERELKLLLLVMGDAPVVRFRTHGTGRRSRWVSDATAL